MFYMNILIVHKKKLLGEIALFFIHFSIKVFVCWTYVVVACNLISRLQTYILVVCYSLLIELVLYVREIS
jgi:hypothetical protein